MLWYFTTIYASPDSSKRQELWNELRVFAYLIMSLGCLLGTSMKLVFPLSAMEHVVRLRGAPNFLVNGLMICS